MACMSAVIDGMSRMSTIIDGLGSFKPKTTEFFQTFLCLHCSDHCFIIPPSPQVILMLSLFVLPLSFSELPTTAHISLLLLFLQNSLYLVLLLQIWFPAAHYSVHSSFLLL